MLRDDNDVLLVAIQNSPWKIALMWETEHGRLCCSILKVLENIETTPEATNIQARDPFPPRTRNLESCSIATWGCDDAACQRHANSFPAFGPVEKPLDSESFRLHCLHLCLTC